MDAASQAYSNKSACGLRGLSSVESNFAMSISGAGLRASGETAAERDLMARLELTGHQRSLQRLQTWCGPQDALAFVIGNAVAGVNLGVSEGHVVRAHAANLTGWALGIAAGRKCNILRLAVAADGKLPDDVRAQVLDHIEADDWTVTRVRMPVREVLRLGPDPETTLAGLGRHTRRNVRKALKLAATEGISFTFCERQTVLGSDALYNLACRTDPAPLRASRIRDFETYADQTGRPFRSVLQAADGTPVSYACGFVEREASYMIYQLNDRAYHRVGPSLMHRGFLMEELARRNCRELTFVYGCSGVLRHSCLPMVTDEYWVMRRTPIARLTAIALARLRPGILLGKLARLALPLI